MVTLTLFKRAKGLHKKSIDYDFPPRSVMLRNSILTSVKNDQMNKTLQNSNKIILHFYVFGKV